jgi:predicted SAM-dependent methyltransferase
MLAREGVQAALLVGDVGTLSYRDASFDALVCISTLEHLQGPQLRRTVGEFERVLRPGGVAVVGVPASGWAMDLLFRAIGFHEIDDHHVSTHGDIAAALAERFALDGEARLPAFCPRQLALYTVFRCRKK